MIEFRKHVDEENVGIVQKRIDIIKHLALYLLYLLNLVINFLKYMFDHTTVIPFSTTVFSPTVVVSEQYRVFNGVGGYNL